MKRCLAAATALALAVACGGGSPTASSSYPAVKGVYGGYASNTAGAARQRWVAPDGTVTTAECSASVSVPDQNGAQFAGTVDRFSLTVTGPQPACVGQGTLAGTVGYDGSIRFTLTQARWAGCERIAGGEYTGRVGNGGLLADGSVTVRCEDGRTMTVEEQITGATTIPPTTPG